NSESPLVVIVRHSNAHVRLRPAVYIKGQTTLRCRFFEGSVPLIQEQEVRIRVIGDKNIDLAILVEVIGDGGKTVRGIQIAEAGLLRHIAERTVTVDPVPMPGLNGIGPSVGTTFASHKP